MSVRSWSSLVEFSKEPKDNFKGLQWSAFGLEVLGGIVVIITAVYLRIADLHPPATDLNWKLMCSDLTLNFTKASNDNTAPLYAIILLIPAIFIIVIELEHALFSTSSYFDNLSSRERLCKSLPRWGRILGMFVMGIFLTSFLADYLMILIVRPKPYFLNKYGLNCPFAYNGTVSDDFYDALKSFPSHLASIAGFCCIFAISHAHSTLDTHNTSVLVPIMSQGFVLLALTASLDQYTSHLNHIWDVVGGLLIGLFLAIYMSTQIPRCAKPSSTKENHRDWMNFWSLFIPRARVNLPPTNAEARNMVQDRCSFDGPTSSFDNASHLESIMER